MQLIVYGPQNAHTGLRTWSEPSDLTNMHLRASQTYVRQDCPPWKRKGLPNAIFAMTDLPRSWGSCSKGKPNKESCLQRRRHFGTLGSVPFRGLPNLLRTNKMFGLLQPGPLLQACTHVVTVKDHQNTCSPNLLAPCQTIYSNHIFFASFPSLIHVFWPFLIIPRVDGSVH